MAKSLRSKVKRRFRGLKRGYITEIKTKPETQQLNNRCQKALVGIEYREKHKKNGFLHPEDPEAVFPQYKQPPIIDLRSTSIPGSGLEWSGASRKKEKIIPHLDEIKNNKNNEMSDEEEQIEEKPKTHTKVSSNNQMVQEKSAAIPKKKKKVSKLRKTIVF